MQGSSSKKKYLHSLSNHKSTQIQLITKNNKQIQTNSENIVSDSIFANKYELFNKIQYDNTNDNHILIIDI